VRKPGWVLGTGSVGAGRDIKGSVTVINGPFRRLADTIFDPRPLERELDLARFTGRQWLIEKIDAYIADPRRESGYVVVQAEAGVGKTALAAHLVWTRPCAYHFTGLEGGRDPARARRSLAAQLIVAWDLADEVLAPGHVLPEDSAGPDWLVKVLWAAAERRDATKPGSPVVLVVDGLDEADPPAPGQDTDIPLGLPDPGRLPAGVFIVATTRFSTPIERLSDPGSWHTIIVDEPDNLQDMRRYLTAAVEGLDARQDLVSLLAERTVDPRWFADVLSARCGGVWIYLRYVLDAIVRGERAPDDLESLPAKLAGYYLLQVRRWRNLGSWRAVGLPALATLATLLRPATVTELAHYSGTEEEPLREWLAERLRPFLVVSSGRGAGRRYTIRHQSLRDLFADPITEEWDHLDSSLEPLRDARKAAHIRIAARYERIDRLLKSPNTIALAKSGIREQAESAELGEIARLLIDDVSEEGEAAALLVLAVTARYLADEGEPSLWGLSEFIEEPSFYSGLQLVSYLRNIFDSMQAGHQFAADLADKFGQSGDEDFVERTFKRVRQTLRNRLTEAGPAQRDESCLRLGNLYVSAQPGEAERFYRECLAIRQRHARERPDDIKVAVALAVPYEKLARLLEDNTERTAEATEYLERALEIRRRVLGAEHPDTIQAVHELLSFLEAVPWKLVEAGKFAEARRLCERGLRIRAETLEPSSPSTVAYLDDLATTLFNKDEFAEARPLYEHALRLREDTLGLDHLATATNLANLLCELNELAEAQRLCERALRIWDEQASQNGGQQPGRDDRAHALCLNTLGRVMHKQGKLMQARYLSERSLEVCQHLGAADPDTIYAAYRLARVRHELGQLNEAEELLERHLSICEQQLRADRWETACLLYGLARLRHDQGRLAEAQALFERDLQITEAGWGPDSVSVACNLHDQARLRRDQGEPAQARLLFERAARIREQRLGPDHPDTVASRAELAEGLSAAAVTKRPRMTQHG